MKFIRAMVNDRLLSKADRLFNGTLSGRIIEVLQNARRIGESALATGGKKRQRQNAGNQDDRRHQPNCPESQPTNHNPLPFPPRR